MVTIINGCDISYTRGDTFEVNLTLTNQTQNPTSVRFQIAQNDNDDIIINKSYNVSENAATITLEAVDKEKLTNGDYIYRMSVIGDDNSVITQLSGNFKVKWGC